MTFLFRCDNCGSEETLAALGKIILSYSFNNDIHRTKINYCLKEETDDWEYNDEDDFRSFESYSVTCPKCGHKEGWFFQCGRMYPFSYLQFPWRRRRRFFSETP